MNDTARNASAGYAQRCWADIFLTVEPGQRGNLPNLLVESKGSALLGRFLGPTGRPPEYRERPQDAPGERAFERGCPEIPHSDQGVQYAATAYVELLTAAGSQISMASVGEPKENGDAERLMRTIKEEEIDLTEYEDFADARRH